MGMELGVVEEEPPPQDGSDSVNLKAQARKVALGYFNCADLSIVDCL